MKRCAILVASPLSYLHPKYLFGPLNDINRYYEFLTSAVGGAWLPGVIIYLKNPSKHQLYNAINWCINVNADIVKIVFSGHGMNAFGDDIVQINDREYVYVNDLHNIECKRIITIIDACRINSQENPLMGIGDIPLPFDRTYLQYSRNMYDNYINQTSTGKLLISSCSVNEYSWDSNKGGLYSISLLESIREWHKSPTNSTILRADIAFRKSVNYLKTTHSNYNQNPVGESWGDGKNFPLAINTKPILWKMRNNAFQSIADSSVNRY